MEVYITLLFSNIKCLESNCLENRKQVQSHNIHDIGCGNDMSNSKKKRKKEANIEEFGHKKGSFALGCQCIEQTFVASISAFLNAISSLHQLKNTLMEG